MSTATRRVAFGCLGLPASAPTLSPKALAAGMGADLLIVSVEEAADVAGGEEGVLPEVTGDYVLVSEIEEVARKSPL